MAENFGGRLAKEFFGIAKKNLEVFSNFIVVGYRTFGRWHGKIFFWWGNQSFLSVGWQKMGVEWQNILGLEWQNILGLEWQKYLGVWIAWLNIRGEKHGKIF